MKAPLPANEERRIAKLEDYNVLDTLPEPAYDDITFLASCICDTPIAVVSFVDRERQWFKSKVGLDVDETPRDVAFCSHAILNPDELLIVPNATEDERFADNPLVTENPAIRFYAGAPLRSSDGVALGTLCVIDLESRTLDESQRKALSALSRQVMGQLELRKAVADLQKYQNRLEDYQRGLEKANESLSEKSKTDALTSLENRASFDDNLEEELHRARRHGHPLSLILLDVDHFKSFNDEFGHSAGDTVLKRVAAQLEKVKRSGDHVARFGGEEFVAILPATNLEGAVIVAERFRRIVKSAPWEHRSVTISAGVATLSEAMDTGRDLIDAADRALYEAKSTGRDRVVEAETPDSAVAV
jgi:diguanylate cyclase (GGDEF)-like protein